MLTPFVFTFKKKNIYYIVLAINKGDVKNGRH